MKCRMLVEVQVDNAALLKQFGENLPMVLASGQIEGTIGKVIGMAVTALPNLQDVQISIIPLALASDKL